MKSFYAALPIVFILALSPRPVCAVGKKQTTKATEISVTTLMIAFIINHQGFALTNEAFDWIAAHFGLVDDAPNDIEVASEELPQAQIIVNELVQGHKDISARMDGLLARLAPLPAARLVKIALASDVPPPVRLLAETTLRNRDILPMLANGRYHDLARLNRMFRRVAGNRLAEVRQIGARLFTFTRPDHEAVLGRATVHAAIALRNGLVPLATILNDWTRQSQIIKRARIAQRVDTSANFVLLDIQAQIFVLMEALASVPRDQPENGVEILHELHGALDLFETLQFEEVENQGTTENARRLGEQIQQATQTRGDDRFPLTGDWEIDALLLGFEKDYTSVEEAARNDESDSAHRLSKGDSLIRGKLIISRDRDAHAGDGYKLHEQTGRHHWNYRGTVILTEINGQHFFLLMNRNNTYRSDYWYLVTPEGQWYRLKKDDSSAKLEETAGPEKKAAQAQARRTERRPLGRVNR